MENKKINIAEILKDCPKGTKLYSPLCGECCFDRLNMGTIICIKQNDQEITFTGGGYYMLPVFDDCECQLFPSKNQRDWSKFQQPFKDGDILLSGLAHDGEIPFIFKQINGFGNAECHCAISCFGDFVLNSDNWTCIEGCRLATEEEKQKLFQVIKANSYKWNEETKTLEKLIEPKFKVGDKIKHKSQRCDICTVKDIQNNQYIFEEIWSTLPFDEQHHYELVSIKVEPRFKVGDQIVKKNSISNSYIVNSVSCEYYGLQLPDKSGEGVLNVNEQDEWELVEDKFDITTLVPFESRVLMRSSDAKEWVGTIYSHYDNKYFFGCGMMCQQCIPYEGNEHLLGTANDCNEFYKNWE